MLNEKKAQLKWAAQKRHARMLQGVGISGKEAESWSRAYDAKYPRPEEPRKGAEGKC